MRLWVELFVSQGLTQAETTVVRKTSAWSKGNKDGNKIKIKLELFYIVYYTHLKLLDLTLIFHSH